MIDNRPQSFVTQAWWKAQMAKLKGEGGLEMLQFLLSLPSPPDVVDTLRAYFPTVPASSLQGLTNELFRCPPDPLTRIMASVR